MGGRRRKPRQPLAGVFRRMLCPALGERDDGMASRESVRQFRVDQARRLFRVAFAEGGDDGTGEPVAEFARWLLRKSSHRFVRRFPGPLADRVNERAIALRRWLAGNQLTDASAAGGELVYFRLADSRLGSPRGLRRASL